MTVLMISWCLIFKGKKSQQKLLGSKNLTFQAAVETAELFESAEAEIK